MDLLSLLRTIMLILFLKFIPYKAMVHHKWAVGNIYTGVSSSFSPSLRGESVSTISVSLLRAHDLPSGLCLDGARETGGSSVLALWSRTACLQQYCLPWTD